MKNFSTTPRSVHLDDEVWEWLGEIAQQEICSRTRIINVLLRQAMNAHKEGSSK